MVTVYARGGVSGVTIAVGSVLMAVGTSLALYGCGVHIGAAGSAGVGLFFGGLGWLLHAR